MGLGETLAIFFQRIFGVCSRFPRNKRLWTELCNFFWWFPFYHFHILLAVLMNLDVIFYLGLEVKPCESRLEFVHPQKTKKQQKKKMKQQKETTKEEENSTLPAKSIFSHVFWAYGSRGNSRDFFSFIFPVSWILREKINCQIFLVISILMFCSLCWWFAKQIFVNFFGGTGHEPKIDVSFDFGVLILDFGVLILGVWILEFWFWGNLVYPFDVSKHEVGRTTSDPWYSTPRGGLT